MILISTLGYQQAARYVSCLYKYSCVAATAAGLIFCLAPNPLGAYMPTGLTSSLHDSDEEMHGASFG